MAHHLTLRQIDKVAHDVCRLVFDRPDGFDFTPGQATDMALDREGWREEFRPFTLTSQPEDPHLEYVIKIYPEHAGVTNEIGTLMPGETVRIGAPWGAIRDAGPGTFIAGGAGVTPFIPILRRRARDGTLGASHLVFANRDERDILLRDEWEAIPGLRTTFVLDAARPGYPQGPVDGDLLEERVGDFSGIFYVCGPPPMTEAVIEALHDHGVSDVQIVREQKPGQDERARLFAA